jgi:hypothetical protein
VEFMYSCGSIKTAPFVRLYAGLHMELLEGDMRIFKKSDFLLKFLDTSKLQLK